MLKKLKNTSLKVVASLTSIIGLAIFQIQTCLVGAEDVFDKVGNASTQTYNKLGTILPAIVGVTGIIALIVWLLAPSEKASQFGKSWFGKILKVVVLIVTFGAIIVTIKNIFGGGGSVLNTPLT